MSKSIEMKVNVTAELLKIKDKYGSLSAENVVTEAKKKRHPSRANKPKSNQSKARYEEKAKAKAEHKTRAQQSRASRRSGKSMKTEGKVTKSTSKAKEARSSK